MPLSNGMADLAHQLYGLLGRRVANLGALHGGDLSDVTLVTLEDGQQVVAKSGPLVGREAAMLTAMGKAHAPVPKVITHSATLMVLDYLRAGTATDAAWHRLGCDLRAMHDMTGDRYGWREDYAFGPLPIQNSPTDNWCAFWAEHRLRDAIPCVPPEIARRIDVLAGELNQIIPERPKASLLHGDLWGGNFLFTHDRGYFIDPACYYGDAEVDLAMLHLFGTPPQPFMDGYGALGDGWQDRRAVYQLWPALVHLRLFGRGYLDMVTTRLDRLGA